MVIRIPHSHMTTPGWNWVVASCLRTFLLISGTFLALQAFEFVVPVLHIPCNHFSWKSYCILWRLLPGTTMGLSATQTSSRDIPSLPCSLWHLSAPWMKNHLLSQRLYPNPLSHILFPFYFWKTLSSSWDWDFGDIQDIWWACVFWPVAETKNLLFCLNEERASGKYGEKFETNISKYKLPILESWGTSLVVQW